MRKLILPATPILTENNIWRKRSAFTLKIIYNCFAKYLSGYLNFDRPFIKIGENSKNSHFSPIPSFKLQFRHEIGLVQHCYLELFSWHGLYFHPTNDQPWLTGPTSTFVYICSNFVPLFCTNAMQCHPIFSCAKYWS